MDFRLVFCHRFADNRYVQGAFYVAAVLRSDGSILRCFTFCPVGYGDIVPVTNGGKLFATIYILVAGSILLNQMSHIAAIPLELRKRRIERAVLTQVRASKISCIWRFFADAR